MSKDPFLLLGLLGQAIFAVRMLLQWIASERAGRSVVPRSFWHLSLLASACVGIYAAISGNLGSVYRKLEQPEAALEAFQRAVDLNTEEKAFEELATSYYRIAALYTEQGDYTLALEYVAHALENDKKVENSVGIAKDYFAMGRIWRKAGDEERAYASLERSLLVYHSLVVLFPGLSLEGDIRVLLENLVELAESLGEEQAAANYRRILSGDEE